MSRDVTATNLAEINAAHLHMVTMVKMEFGTPVYAHSGYGTITYDSNDYLGVGHFGAVSAAEESESLGPGGITLQLSGVDSALITEALDSGSYGDVITIYTGYRQDDGTLVDDPWLTWRGTFEYASISMGDENVVSIAVQHDLAVLEQTDGSRFTDEDQQQRFASDDGFEFVQDNINVKLSWGGGPVGRGDNAPTGPGVTPRTPPGGPAIRLP